MTWYRQREEAVDGRCSMCLIVRPSPNHTLLPYDREHQTKGKPLYISILSPLHWFGGAYGMIVWYHSLKVDFIVSARRPPSNQ